MSLVLIVDDIAAMREQYAYDLFKEAQAEVYNSVYPDLYTADWRAKLRRNSGTQTYTIPASVAKSISSIHIYCKKFSSNFGTARVN